ncbi:MAG TPA: pyruvate formate lyase family protein, partial [Phototrophicaceae bacterium]|nr:pyruvate formate lyase family protein [Phototrophicaceae bacterium]
MAISARVAHLRQQSLDAVPTLSPERAELVTQFYQQQTVKLSIPVERARLFEYLLARKTICINDGELIVGEKGPAPKATPTYPELCCHSRRDLDILNTREKVWFRVSPETVQVYEDQLIPYWQGKTMR